jgi:hypothetical protein
MRLGLAFILIDPVSKQLDNCFFFSFTSLNFRHDGEILDIRIFSRRLRMNAISQPYVSKTKGLTDFSGICEYSPQNCLIGLGVRPEFPHGSVDPLKFSATLNLQSLTLQR